LKGEQATKNAFRVIDEETDPLVKGSPTYAVGPRIFELDNTRMTRPDLNSAFPEIVGGTDYGVHFDPAPLEEFAPELVAKYAERLDKNGKPMPINHKDLTANTPKVFIDEARLSRMQKAGYAAGGVAHMAGGGAPKGGGMAILEAVAKLKREADEARKMRMLTTPIPMPDKHITGMQHVLPPAIREANKAVFMAKSKDPDRYYHGTKANIQHFKPNTANATFLTPEPDFAGAFALEQEMADVANGYFKNFYDDKRYGANILPVRAQVTNPFDATKAEHLEALEKKLAELYAREPTEMYQTSYSQDKKTAKDYLNQLKKLQSEIEAEGNHDMFSNWSQIEHPVIQDAIRQMGHDAFYALENGHKNLAVYDPRKIKSDIGNRGTYDTMSHDINESHGGTIHGQ
jgi:hypothetical protein